MTNKFCHIFLFFLFTLSITPDLIVCANYLVPEKIRIYNITNGLRDDYIFCIDQDLKGNLWIGTRTGTSNFNGQLIENYGELAGFTDKTVWSIYCDSRGSCWFGTDGDGLFLYDGNRWGHLKKKGYQTNNSFFDSFISEDSKGNIWGGGENARLFKYKNNKLSQLNDKIQAMIETNNEEIFGIKFNGTCLYRYFPDKNRLKKVFNDLESTLDIALSSDNAIWIAGDMSYIAKSTDNGQSFEKFYFKKDMAGNLWDLFIDRDDNIWLACSNYVIMFDGKEFNYFERWDGLPIGHYKYIYQDEDGHLWFCCFGGLAQFDNIPPKINLIKPPSKIVKTSDLYFRFTGDDTRFGTDSDKITYEYFWSEKVKEGPDKGPDKGTDKEKNWKKTNFGHVYLNNLKNNTDYEVFLRATDDCNNKTENKISFSIAINPKAVPFVNSLSDELLYLIQQDQEENKKKIKPKQINKFSYEISEEDFIDFTKIEEE